MIREMNVRLLQLLLNRALEVPTANPVERRVALPANFRDVYRFAGDGTLKGWVRYHGNAAPQSFTAEGELLLEGDGPQATVRPVGVRYRGAGKGRFGKTLHMQVVE
jgi:hypothetical protein